MYFDVSSFNDTFRISISLISLSHACDQALAAIFVVEICLGPEYDNKFDFMKNEGDSLSCFVCCCFFHFH